MSDGVPKKRDLIFIESPHPVLACPDNRGTMKAAAGLRQIRSHGSRPTCGISLKQRITVSSFTSR
jgi:hypothetical protein